MPADDTVTGPLMPVENPVLTTNDALPEVVTLYKYPAVDEDEPNRIPESLLRFIRRHRTPKRLHCRVLCTHGLMAGLEYSALPALPVYSNTLLPDVESAHRFPAESPT